MSRTLFVDPIGGAAGDMLLAALIDAGASEDAVRAAVEPILQGRLPFHVVEVRRGGLRALAIDVGSPGGRRSLRELVEEVGSAGLPERVRTRAAAALQRIGEAEAAVHGLRGPEEVELHELGDDDTILDVVGVAVALESLDVDRVVVGALPLGFGRTVPGGPGHGDIPLPSPAAVHLLRGFALRGGFPEESVTPTAAAIFAAMAEPSEQMPPMQLEAAGYGAGSRDPAGRPNVVRALLGADRALGGSGEGGRERVLTVLDANLDDLTPELVADAAAALFAAGALDVWTTPATMKKGRTGVVLSALCEPGDEPTLREAFFLATSTFGVRATTVRRTELARRTVAVDVAGGTVRVKIGMLGGRVVTAKPEHDDVAALAARDGRPVRAVHEEAAAAARALGFDEVPR
jgi:uncharacterized protein (TIGR00299 family) protein